MLIPVRQFHTGIAAQPTVRALGELRGQQSFLLAGAGVRCLVLLLGALWWRSAAPALVPALILALGAALLGLAALALRPLPFGPTLLIDATAIGMLIHATGDAASPFLLLTLSLVALGGLAGGGRDALIGGGAGVLVLLLVCLAGPSLHSEMTLGMAGAQAAFSGIAAWALGPGRAAELLGGRAHEEQQQRYESALRTVDWQRLNVAALSTCTTLDELTQRAAERAMVIARTHASVSLRPSPLAGDVCAFEVPVAGGRPGRLEVHAAPEALDDAQREALQELALLTGMRAGQLQTQWLLQRQQDAVMALWETIGMLRVAPGMDDTMREAFRRLAQALDLDWLALVGPGERQAVSPLMIVRGRQTAEAPRIDGVQLRVAAEAMRSGRPLVRAEGGVTLACLPMHLGDDTPLVLVARGDASEAGTQALLMVFGDLVAAGIVRAVGQ